MSSAASIKLIEKVGAHIVESDGDDLIILRARGDISAEEARRLIVIDRELFHRNGYSLILIDATAGGKFGPSARQALFAEMERHPGYLGSSAMFGASGALALVMKLVLRAVTLLAKTFDDEMQIFATEQEARAFLIMRRPQRQKQAAQRPG